MATDAKQPFKMSTANEPKSKDGNEPIEMIKWQFRIILVQFERQAIHRFFFLFLSRPVLLISFFLDKESPSANLFPMSVLPIGFH